jgi:hypothetical protein
VARRAADLQRRQAAKGHVPLDSALETFIKRVQDRDDSLLIPKMFVSMPLIVHFVPCPIRQVR